MRKACPQFLPPFISKFPWQRYRRGRIARAPFPNSFLPTPPLFFYITILLTAPGSRPSHRCCHRIGNKIPPSPIDPIRGVLLPSESRFLCRARSVLKGFPSRGIPANSRESNCQFPKVGKYAGPMFRRSETVEVNHPCPIIPPTVPVEKRYVGKERKCFLPRKDAIGVPQRLGHQFLGNFGYVVRSHTQFFHHFGSRSGDAESIDTNGFSFEPQIAAPSQ